MDAETAARRWAKTWELAWRSHDADALAEVYADGVVFRSSPFRDRRDPVEYAGWAFASEEPGGDVRVSDPLLLGGERAAVEWWSVVRDDAGEATLAGVSLLRFDAEGKVVEQRDYWNRADGSRRAHSEWGR